MASLSFLSSSIFLLLLLASFSSCSVDNPQTLVIIGQESFKHTHSSFFQTLADIGHNLTFKTPDDPSLELQKYGEFLFDNLVIFAPHVEEFNGSVTVESILQFIDEGRNVLIAGAPDASETIRELLRECGVELGDGNSYVIDHLNFDSSNLNEPHNLIVADSFSDAPLILGSSGQTPILYRGTGISFIQDSKGSLIQPLLRGSPTSYTAPLESIVKEVPPAAGHHCTLVAILQARNNARVCVSGSMDLFSNKLFNHPIENAASGKKYPKSGNQEFVSELATWNFGTRGTLRAFNIRHRELGFEHEQTDYVVNDTLIYSVDIENWNGKEWVPFVADDVQLEFVMLDPYLRITLEHDGKGHYETTFVAPDVYGIFTFRLVYQRLGYSFINSNVVVKVRPYLHTEFERFIFSALPYYASSFSMLFGLFVFSWAFLYNSPK